MATVSFVFFLLIINILLFVGANTLDEKNANNSVDKYEAVEARPENLKSANSEPALAGMRPSEKMAEMLLRSGSRTIENSVASENNDPIEEGNRKILKFGKRVIESVKRNGIMGKEARLMKSGKYRIDWWRKDRRLERMRKRLSDELERKPELKNRLWSLGWRNASDPVYGHKKIHTDLPVVNKPAHETDNDFKKTLLYKTLIMSFEHLRNGASSRGKEARESAIFVYMPITVVASPSEIDRIKDMAMTEMPETDSPTKISLNSFDRLDLDEIASDIGVVEVTSGDTSTSRAEDAIAPGRSSGQVYDSDRLLQLIPLVVEELRNGLVSEDERRTFGWIFGKRLWQLIEREASKRHGETMDRDFAMFLLKGELAERDPENGRRRRQRQRRGVSIVVADDGSRSRDYDYDLRDENDDDRSAESDDRSSRNFDDGKTNEPSFVELIELAVKHETRKLEKEAMQRSTNEKRRKNELANYDYDDDSHADENNYY